jgi:hypothetical protein
MFSLVCDWWDISPLAAVVVSIGFGTVFDDDNIPCD